MDWWRRWNPPMPIRSWWPFSGIRKRWLTGPSRVSYLRTSWPSAASWPRNAEHIGQRRPALPGLGLLERFKMPTKIYISKGDITDMAVEAIVNPANTDLLMGSGVAAAIRRKGGERIQEECERLAPIRLGAAVVTTAGNLKALFVIHAAAIRPGEKATAESIRLATRQI